MMNIQCYRDFLQIYKLFDHNNFNRGGGDFNTVYRFITVILNCQIFFSDIG